MEEKKLEDTNKFAIEGTNKYDKLRINSIDFFQFCSGAKLRAPVKVNSKSELKMVTENCCKSKAKP